ncbi:hypothetical protein [Tepidibacter sp. Z1-5]|uniref:hypothetical protein n=1 Tax=Tepidibacter sp. Z1-5 TaxID=3134138 RepID=UPI0030BBA3DF
MSGGLFSKSYEKKRKKFVKYEAKIGSLQDKRDAVGEELVEEFNRTVPKGYIESLGKIIDIEGNEKEKDDYKEFCENHKKGCLTGNNVQSFYNIDEYYRDLMPEYQLKEDYFSQED